MLDALEQRFNEYGKVTVASGPARGNFSIVFRESDFAQALA